MRLGAGEKGFIILGSNIDYMALKKHPFFEHSTGDFYLALRDGDVVGRIFVGENQPFNKYHQTRKAQFYYFDVENDLGTARALFDAAFDWARERGLGEGGRPQPARSALH